MGTVTIVNKTNAMINSCISMGVNYSWCNKLSPGKYYVHDGGAGTFTLSTNFWCGEQTEFSTSAAGIAILVAGLSLAVIGLGCAVLTGGTSVFGTVAALEGLSSFFMSASGVTNAIGISIAVRDLVNTPCKVMGIQARDHLKYVAEGGLEYEEEIDANGQKTLKIVNATPITLRPISEKEFKNLIEEEGFSEHGSEKLAGALSTLNDLQASHLIRQPIMIKPGLGGEAVWEIENDASENGAAVQLWQREGNPVQWEIVPLDENDGQCRQFYLYNRKLKRYASVGSSDQIVAEQGMSEAGRFHLLKSEMAGHTCCYAFIPIHPERTYALMADNGNLGNSTKIKLGQLSTTHPEWAVWALTKV